MMIGVTHVSYVSEGDQLPVLVLEAGMGEGFETWEPAYSRRSEVTTTIAYIRPGYSKGAFYRKESDGKRAPAINRGLPEITLSCG